MEYATKQATLTPLRTARAVSEILEYQRILAEIGNPNARCDLAVGALLAFAALKGMQYNIFANTAGLKDIAFRRACSDGNYRSPPQRPTAPKPN